MAFIQTTPSQLRIGQYIKLECSWWSHPFAKNKFKISSNKEIRTIRSIKKCQVFYDPDLSDPEIEEETPSADVPNEQALARQAEEERQQLLEERRAEQIQACEEHTIELQKASYVYQQVMSQAKIGMKRISDGHAAGLKSMDQVYSTLTHSLTKPESAMALIDILASASAEDPLIAHSLNVSVVSLLIGREFEFDKDQMYALGMAALLHDIGKHNFPMAVRHKRSGLTKAEQQEYGNHSQLGKEMVERFGAIPPQTVDAIYQHHERMNGTGFPLGLHENEIGLMAKIIMAADEYDHLCHQADSNKNMPPAEALSSLYDEYVVNNLLSVGDQIRDLCDGVEPQNDVPEEGSNEGGQEPAVGIDKAKLSEEVIVLMVRALGVYPPGTIVELTNGLLGLVTSVNFEERTKPSVMMYVNGVPRKEARLVDLAKEDDVAIVHSVRPQLLSRDVQEYFFAGRG